MPATSNREATMTRTITALAASLTACALCATAHAAPMESSASVSVTGLTFELIDLDLTDGIAPSLQYFSDSDTMRDHWLASASTSESTWPGTGSSNDFDFQSAPGGVNNVFAPLQAGSSNAGGQSSAVMTTSSIVASANTSMNAVTAGSREISAYAQLLPNAFDFAPYILYSVTPNTAVRITGQYELSARVQAQDPHGYGFAQANLEFMAWVDEGGDVPVYHGLESIVDAGPNTSSDTKAGSFDFLLSNASANRQDQVLSLRAAAYSSLTSSVSDVPEPTSIALMLAGLGVASVFGRRQQKLG